ncbi:hypothetical protein C8R43DRAFT_464557 [Mycena crocata]|nr:hypothetical protein C8R43DRAFT_464557 [Mycena crocata]
MYRVDSESARSSPTPSEKPHEGSESDSESARLRPPNSALKRRMYRVDSDSHSDLNSGPSCKRNGEENDIDSEDLSDSESTRFRIEPPNARRISRDPDSIQPLQNSSRVGLEAADPIGRTREEPPRFFLKRHISRADSHLESAQLNPPRKRKREEEDNDSADPDDFLTWEEEEEEEEDGILADIGGMIWPRNTLMIRRRMGYWQT